jgi:hypothetical protein
MFAIDLVVAKRMLSFNQGFAKGSAGCLKVVCLDDQLRKVELKGLPPEYQRGLYGPQPQRSKFDFLLLESIDQAIADLLGRRARDAIYDHLATHYRYGREEIPEKIDQFYQFLEEMFGSGAKTLGRTVIRRMFDKLGYEYVNVPGFQFFDYLEALKSRVTRDDAGREQTPTSTHIQP